MESIVPSSVLVITFFFGFSLFACDLNLEIIAKYTLCVSSPLPARWRLPFAIRPGLFKQIVEV